MILTYLISVFGTLYFMIKKRKFDLYTLAFFSAIIYFSPAFFGYVLEPVPTNNGFQMTRVSIDTKTYSIFNIVLISIVIGAFFSDIINSSKKESKWEHKKLILESNYISFVYASISLVFFLLVAIKNDFLIFSGKTIVWAEHGIEASIITTAISLLAVTSYLLKQRIYFTYSIIMIAILFLMGNRSLLAIVVLSIILLRLYNMNKIKLFTFIKIKNLVMFSLFLFLIFMGKRIYGSFQRNGMIGVYNTLINKENYLESIISSEPFAIQNILNKIIITGYDIGTDSLKTLPYHIFIIPSKFGVNTQTFSEDFKNTFYPYVDYGMAYNFWAESLAIGGGWFFILILVIYLCFLFLFNRLINIKDANLKSLFTITGVYWAFYIHRNSLDTIITFERHTLYIYLIAVFISILIFYFLRGGKKT